MVQSNSHEFQDGIALIGMSGRFPGASNVDLFWKNIKSGVESISFFSEEDSISSGADPSHLSKSRYVRAGGTLEGVEYFDATFFGYSPRQAEIMDPQHRLFLECAWHALEHAGYDPDRCYGRIGIYAGAGMHVYLISRASRLHELLDSVGAYALAMENDKDHLATRVAYKLNLRGPAVTVQTACSTSLVAVHLACQSLLNGECEMALAGGVSIRLPQKSGYLSQEGGILSPDGHCRAFDADAQGTVPGSGIGIVVLKRIADALADGDNVYAIIRGSAVNNDGSLKAGYTAPSVDGQAAVIAEALAMAELSPGDIHYIEAHGTGTPLGDPVELAALTKVFKARTKERNLCAIGSVKSNIGHLDAAAGVAGLIKTALAIHHKIIPPSLHFNKPNPHINFADSPFYVITEAGKWETDGVPRRAGVSSFGIGGTNAHVVLEEAPPRATSGKTRPLQLLVLSARSEVGLEKTTANLVEHLKQAQDVNLGDLAYTLQAGRKHFNHRRMLVCRDSNDAIMALQRRDSDRVLTEMTEPAHRPVAFMFPGQGAQHVGMGSQLHGLEPRFRESLDLCCEILAPDLGFDLRDLLCGSRHEGGPDINETIVAQPALFAMQYSLAQLWLEWGIRPAAMIGHSLGEYVAACIAGVMSLESALKLVAFRGSLMQQLPKGAMVAIALSEQGVQPYLKNTLSLAAINGSLLCVVSGPADEVAELEKRLREEGIAYRRLRTSHAFHSSMMEPVLAAFEERLKEVEFKSPQVPYLSNISGTWITSDEATDPTYWKKHLRTTVQFSAGIRELLKDPSLVLMEIGPGETLASMVKIHSSKNPQQIVLTSLPLPKGSASDQESMLTCLGKLWLAGVKIDWSGFCRHEKRHRIPLPVYPFDPQRHWIESSSILSEKRRQIPVNDGEAVERPATVDECTGIEPHADRRSRIEQILLKAVSKQFAIDPSRVNTQASFVEMGVDSLLLMQVSQGIKRLFHVEVPFRLLMEEITTLEALATRLDKMLPPEAILPGSDGGPSQASKTSGDEVVQQETQAGKDALVSVPPPAAADAPEPSLTPEQKQSDSNTGGSISQRTVKQIIEEQLQVMSRQLELLQSYGPAEPASPKPSQSKVVTSVQVASSHATALESVRKEAAAGGTDLETVSRQDHPEPYVPHKPFDLDIHRKWKPHQQEYLETLLKQVNARTARSKEHIQSHRLHHADSRTSMGFRLRWKELVYPLVIRQSQGSRIWDIDENEYIDLTMGFGVHLFGHNPPFLVEALEEQIRLGIHLGPQCEIAGEAAELACELTGMERVTFCNSGTEAVMVALRIARAVTGRDRVALFAGSYHGNYDEVLARPGKPEAGGFHAVPGAPGITSQSMKNTILLRYGDPEALTTLKTCGSELAAVLVEPVQGRQPDVQPREFLHELRRITEGTGTALVFDEMITGFRIHTGGAQAWFGVQADIATYGKVLGGGMPVGAVAGKAAFMDAIDGGMWTYGDTSYPPAVHTYYAGTFCKHPLTMAAVRAVLKRLKDEGPDLQKGLNQSTSRLAERLNSDFHRNSLPLRVVHFGSLFQFKYPPGIEAMELLFYHLLLKGVYVWEGRTCFLSTAHTESDIDYMIGAISESISEMLKFGVFSHDSAGAAGSRQILISRGPGAVGVPESEPEPKLKVTTDSKSEPVGSQPETVPLTDMQRQLWIVSQMSDDASCAYNECLPFQMHGPLDPAIMQTAFQKLVDRHEALRTGICPDGDRQRILPAVDFKLSVVDISNFEGDEQERRTREWLSGELRKPFDLAQAPLMRAYVVKLQDEHHLLILLFHHIIDDGWSNGVLLKELSLIYVAESKGSSTELPAPMQLREFVGKVTSEEQLAAMVRNEDYWLNQFADAVPNLELPTDRTRPALKTYAGERQCITIEPGLYGEFKRLCARQGCSILVALLASYGLLLQRLSGQNDVVVGIPLAGRSLGDDRDLVGCCINFVPLRFHITSNPTFAAYLAHVKKQILDAQEHQDYRYGEFMRRLNLPHDPSRSPVVEAMFNVDRIYSLKFFGLDLDPYENPITHCKFDISFNIYEFDDRLRVFCDYNTDLFDSATIERWLCHYRQILAESAADCQRPILDMPLLPESERRQVVEEWNNTREDYPLDVCLQDLVKAQVERSPDAIAVISESRHITYAELNMRANQLAHYLRKLGVERNAVVGICLDRSVEMVIGLLGVLKAGGAYLPLDPDFPKERLGVMVQDAGVSVILTRQGLLAELPSVSANVVCLDRDWEKVAGENKEDPAASAGPSDLAYVIYTSGSTGRPKGVMIPHKGICNHMLWMQAEYGLTGQDRVLQKTRLSFDVSVWELFWPLITGGCLVLARPQGQHDAEYLAEVIAREKITIVHFVPSVLRVFLEQGELSGCQGLKRVICIGEELSYGLQERFFEKLGGRGAELHNLYGPTETSVDVTYWRCGRGGARRRVPIGRPIANTQIYVVDAQLQPVPIGVVGALHVGGIGLARGYLKRPELTAEKFLPDPLGEEPGARIYMTGDLARWLPDGNLEFLGRMDNQVKIRGFRIELEEIEGLLNQHPDVRQAVVIGREDRPGERRLAAYVISRQERRPSIGELRRYLELRLPSHSIPSAFVFVDTLPLSSSGKLDRRALPEPEGTRPDLEEAFVAPRDSAEESVAKIWSSVLGVEKIGVYDNYFELGGNSLQAIQIISRLRSTFRTQIPVSRLFEAPTVAGLAEHIRRANQTSVLSAVPGIEPVSYGEKFPLSFAQERLWILEQVQPHNLAYNLSAAVRLRGPLDVVMMQTSLDEIVRRQQSLRTSFAVIEGRPSQEIRPTLTLPVSLIDLTTWPEAEREEEARRLAAEDARRPFDLSEGPLLRTNLIRIGADDHVLQGTMHHIISDAWSMGLFIREMSVLYQAFSSGHPSPLAELPIQYKDYAVWQRKSLQSEVLDDLFSYWKKQLDGLPLLELPTDRPRPAVFTYRGGVESFAISKTVGDGLKQLSHVENVTPFMTLLAAFKVVLHHYTDQEDIVVGVDSANRGQSEVEEIIGFFVNLLVLRTDLSGNPTFREVLARVRNVALGAFNHQDMPFDRLVTRLKWNRDMSRFPLFDVNFSFQEIPRPGVNISKLTGSSFQIFNKTSRFDLSLIVLRRAQDLSGALIYNVDLFEAARIAEMVHLYQALLEIVIEQPDSNLAELRRFLNKLSRQRLGQKARDLRESAVRKLRDSTHSLPA